MKVKNTVLSAVIGAVLAVALAACSTPAAKQIVLSVANGDKDTTTVGQRVNIVGDLSLADATIDTFDVLVEEKAPGGNWTAFRKIVAHKSSTSIGFAVVKSDAGDYVYRATVSGKNYGPFVSGELVIHYQAKK